MSDIRDYQVHHLLLLVGSNPIPNAVAGKLLIRPGGTITLIHSKDGFKIAQRLKSWFVNAGFSDSHIGFKEVQESEASMVYDLVHEALEQYERNVLKHVENDSSNASGGQIARVGLNYTGGTKVMSVHAYRALENWAKSLDRGEAIFSYLDARTLQLRFDRIPGGDAISFPVGLEVDIGIHDLLALHNWRLEKEPAMMPVLPQSAASLLTIHSSSSDSREWADWLHNELFRNARKPVAIRPPFWVSQSKKESEGQYDVERPGDKWKNNPELQKLEISWPDLPTLRETMKIGRAHV